MKQHFALISRFKTLITHSPTATGPGSSDSEPRCHAINTSLCLKHCPTSPCKYLLSSHPRGRVQSATHVRRGYPEHCLMLTSFMQSTQCHGGCTGYLQGSRFMVCGVQLPMTASANNWLQMRMRTDHEVEDLRRVDSLHGMVQLSSRMQSIKSTKLPIAAIRCSFSTAPLSLRRCQRLAHFSVIQIKHVIRASAIKHYKCK